jgi:hypothetical protein
MAEDRYRLGPLRDVRERAEAVGRGHLATKIGDASITAAVVADAHTRSAAARAALAAAVVYARAIPATATAHERVLADRFIARRRHELAAARDEELRAELAHDRRQTEVDAARLQLARARADRQVIERHFERWRDEQKKRADNAAD